MSRIRWFSGSIVLGLALLGTACRSESERAEGAVREPADRTGDRSGAAPGSQDQKAGEQAREQTNRIEDTAEQLAREGQQLGKEAREQADRVGEKAEQLAERGRQVGRDVNEQMNRVGEQTGALNDQRGGARDQGAQPTAPRDQGTSRDQAAPKEQGASRDQAAPKEQGASQGRGAQGQAGRDTGKAQPADAATSAREVWTQAAKDDDYQVTFGRDGAVIATKQAKRSGERMPDEALRNTVGGKLADSDHDAVKKLNVTVRNGVVTLQGTVASLKEATEAVKQAMDAEGVTKVISQIRHGS